MAVDWSSDGMHMWKEKAVKQQQEYCETLGASTWREFEPSHYVDLKRDIGFALFGDPEEEPCKTQNENTGYTHKKLKHINTIFDIIKKCVQNNTNPKNILASFLFVSGKKSDGSFTASVIRILQFDISFRQNIHLFIDSCGRVYKNWQDYLDNNTLPESVLCYPRHGVYSAVNGAVDVEFGISPAGRTAAKVLQVFDIGGTVLNLGAGGALIAGMFTPVAIPVLAGAVVVSMVTGAYSTGRNIETLVDRDQHQQSIGLDSAESRNCWLGIGGGVMSVLSAGAVAAAAATAQEAATMPLAKKIAIKSVGVSSCVFNGLAVANGILKIIDKVKNEEKITALDVFQLTSAVLFFTHSVISTHQAMSIINSMGKNSPEGSTGVVNAMKYLTSKMVGLTGTLNGVLGVTGVCSPAVLTIAEKTGLLSVCCEVGRKLMEIAKRGLTIMSNCVLEVGSLLRRFWESWQEEIAEVVDMICRAFGVKHWSELVIKGCRHIEFHHITETASNLIVEKRSLIDGGSTAITSHKRQTISDNSSVVETGYGPNNLVDEETENGASYYDEVTNISAKFVGQMCRNSEDFRRCMTFICKFVRSEFQKRKSNYEKTWEMVKDLVDEDNFKKKYGISGNPYNHFLQEVFDEFKNEEHDAFTVLQATYMKQNAGTSAQQKEQEQGFVDAEGVRFYPFHNMQGTARNGMLSEQQYREMAAKLKGRSADRDSIYMSDSGDTAVIQATDTMMVQCWLEDGKVSGIAALLSTSSE